MAEQDQVQENKKKYQIQHDRPNCIGCAACAAVAPDFWTMNEDEKSDIDPIAAYSISKYNAENTYNSGVYFSLLLNG